MDRSLLTPFIDFLFLVLIVVYVLFAIAFLHMNPPAQERTINLDSAYVIVTRWADDSRSDVDTWVMPPGGAFVGFPSKDNGFIHLERDDTGLATDSAIVDGERVEVGRNVEYTYIRTPVDGDYTVNLHFYAQRDKTSVPVTVELYKLEHGNLLASYSAVLEDAGQEVTVINFRIFNGEVVLDSLNNIPNLFVSRVRGR